MNRTLLLASACLLVGGFVVFGLYQQAYVEESAGGPPVEVLVAAIDIQLGQPVRQEWLTTRELPQSYVEERHLPASAARDLVGFPLAQAVHAGEAILRTDLSTLTDARRTLSGSIPAGMRAATVTTTATSTFGGLLRPGDRVDVALSVGGREQQSTWRGVLVLENLLVLAVGQEFEVRESDSQEQQVRMGRATNVTLQVTIQQGQMLTMARQRGRISLLLRNPNDIEISGEHPDLFAADILEATRRVRFLRRTAPIARADTAPAAGTVAPAGLPPTSPDPGGLAPADAPVATP
jgi:pilus assembly protein CpaB